MASGWPWLAGWWSGWARGHKTPQRGRTEAKTKGEGERVGYRWPLAGRLEADRAPVEARQGQHDGWSQNGRTMVQEGKQERPPFSWWPVGMAE